MSNKLLSIIVPMYNVERYIKECLDSLVLDDASLMECLEVIVVNDGSTDRSAEISREFVKRYPGTFYQIDKANGGHGSACNKGLECARGKYIRFLDSDDWLTGLDQLMEKLAVCDADFVITRLRWLYQDSGSVVTTSIPAITNKTLPVNCLDPSIIAEYKYVTNFGCSTYKAEWLKPTCPLFLEGVLYDDAILYIAPLLYAHSFIAYDIVLYNYRMGREGQSMDMRRQIERVPDRLKVLQQMDSLIKSAEEERDGRTTELIEEEMDDRRLVLIKLLCQVKPYRKAASYDRHFKSIGSSVVNPPSNQIKRYNKYPFFLFYWLERVRSVYLRLKFNDTHTAV